MAVGDSWRHKTVKVTSILVLGAGLLGLFMGVRWFWVIWVLGFAILVPILGILLDVEDAEKDEDPPSSEPEPDALQTLRDRYARGELTDEQFERKLERLLETEQLEDVEDRSRERDVEYDRASGQ